jgi:LuxR family quorum sensing-dependent transcriptional regulator
MASTRHQLSPREIEVLTCIGNGQTTDAAASALAISKRTVEDHLRHACAKLGASNRTHAVAIAVKRNLITPNIRTVGVAPAPGRMDGEDSSGGH